MPEENQIDSFEYLLRKELSLLLIALGATSQENLAPGLALSMARRYREWLAQNPDKASAFVQKSKYWYAVFEDRKDGVITTTTAVCNIHPFLVMREKFPKGTILTFFQEIPQEAYEASFEPHPNDT